MVRTALCTLAVAGCIGVPASTLGWPPRVCPTDLINRGTVLRSPRAPIPLGPAFAATQNQPPSATNIETGLKTVKFISVDALSAFRGFVDAAERDPSRHFDLVLTLDGDTLAKASAVTTVMRSDPGIPRGDNFCILLGMSAGIKAEDLYKEIAPLLRALCIKKLALPITLSTGIALSVEGSPLTMPVTWAVGTSLASACYLSTTTIPAKAIGGLTGATVEYLCDMIRVEPAEYPGDPSQFNPRSPTPFPPTRNYPDLTPDERQWRQHRDHIDFLKQTYRTRVGGYPGMSAAEVQKRRAYAAQAKRDDLDAFNFRVDLANRTLNWRMKQQEKLAKMKQQFVDAENAIKSTQQRWAEQNYSRSNQAAHIAAAKAFGNSLVDAQVGSVGSGAVEKVLAGLNSPPATESSGPNSGGDSNVGKQPQGAGSQGKEPDRTAGCPDDDLCVTDLNKAHQPIYQAPIKPIEPFKSPKPVLLRRP